MKTIHRFFLAAALCLAFVIPASATIKQVTGTLSVAVPIITFGPDCKKVTIQNNGSVDVRLSFDGGSTFPNTTTPTGTDPTTTTGYLLKAGMQWVETFPHGVGTSSKPYVAISSGGSVTLDITTDDSVSK